MSVVLKYVLATVMAAMAFTSCNDNKSLQKYLVEKQDDNNFVKIDLATSLLQAEGNDFSEEEKNILNTVKKINVVAFPLTDDNMAEYEIEKQNAIDVLSQEKYKTLMKYGSNSRGATLKYLGEEEAIDELIVFASDNEMGFAVFRLLGDNMRPEDMLKLMKGIDQGDIDVSSLKSLGNLLDLPSNDSVKFELSE